MANIDLKKLKSTVKVIVIDLDGTVLHPGATMKDRSYLTEDAVSVFKECTAKGYKTLIATGRNRQSAEPYRAQMDLRGPMIYYNGAELVDMPSINLIHTAFLDKETALFCTKLAREYNIHFHIFFASAKDPTLELLVSEKHSQAAEFYSDRTGLNFVYTDIMEKIKEPDSICVKALYIAEDPDLLETLRGLIREKFNDKINIAKSASQFLEVMNRNASKGLALEAALKNLNVKPEEVIAFGDEENDLSMLNLAGFSCATDNATPAVKAAVQRVVPSCEEDGVPGFIREYLL